MDNRSAGLQETGSAAYVLDEQVGFILRQVQQRHATIFVSHFASDLTPTQWAVIAKLAEIGEVSQNLLGRHTAMDVATIKGVVERLVKRGLVRTQPDPVDRRRLSISLSPAGRDCFDASVANARTVTEETLQPLDAQERQLLLGLLEKIR
ncbi:MULTISPECIES: MarR family winged helix-turn-helix transcriptional regulator [unclassified Aureimonas]|uniref:MarR family winged helix-turn-helix transcriptional regulator n=1 Tax=unclassified Aureimonas TaxID=2615206 RepID=UPI0006FD2FD4|nr:MULTISPECIES: MarR family winged helix-turn-helix transcriptional regulator [unclassified Aureimonas]KQT55226.1 MarR family transcriptional regulator [Aureimonas sp. Leaf427]KQT71018.1 MarR family transcriptional regulator [Aureimonas sp. Leaf460]